MKPDFLMLMEKPEFNTLASVSVWDNTRGNASELGNKTSVWIVCDEVTLRICNIAMRGIDWIDDFWLDFYVVQQALNSIVDPQGIMLYMSPMLGDQLKTTIYGIPVFADRAIKNNEKPVH